MTYKIVHYINQFFAGISGRKAVSDRNPVPEHLDPEWPSRLLLERKRK